MGVIDGQPVDAATTNPAFLDQNQNDVMHGILGMDNAVPASGAVLGNIQGGINHLLTTTGATEVADGTTYASQKRITNGQNHPTALSNLDTAFHETTGHKHTGVAGDGPLIAGTGIGGVPLLGTYVQATDLTGITGVSTVVTAALIGEVSSSGPTVEGLVTTPPDNRVFLTQSATAFENESHYDSAYRTVYGRLTFAAGVWTLSFYVSITGVETAFNFTSAATIRWYYQKLYKRLVNAPVYSDQLVQAQDKDVRSLAKSAGDTTQVFGDVTLEEGSNITITRTLNKFNITASASATSQDETVALLNFAASPKAVVLTDHVFFVDCTAGNVVINLYQILGNTGKRIRVKKTDASSNTVTINAFAGDTIDGATPLVITNRYQAFTLLSFTNLWGIFA